MLSMMINLRLALALCVASPLVAAPLTKPTAVHTRPDVSSPAVTVFSAGTEPTPATGDTLPVPGGWLAVELKGPHQVYLHGRDLTKNLDVKPGAEFRTQPKADAPVLTAFEPGDNATITGLSGRWTQFKLEKTVVGYIQISDTASAAPAPAAPQAVESAAAPATPSVETARPAPRAVGDESAASLPRLFKGQLVPSRRGLIGGRRPYDFQLNDDAGERYAYLDTSRLLLTEQIDKYVDRTVVVYGTARPVPNTKDIVIVVESLQLQ